MRRYSSLGPRLRGLRFDFGRFAIMLYNLACPVLVREKKVPAPGIAPGRLLTQPRACKARTSTYFVTRADSLDVGTGEP